MRCGSRLTVLGFVILSASAVGCDDPKAGGSSSGSPASGVVVESPVISHATDEQRKAIQEADSLSTLKAALMAAYPDVKDVTWTKATKDDPKTELWIAFRGDANPNSYHEMLSVFREIMPIMVKAKNPWQIINLDQGCTVIFDRTLAAGIDFQSITEKEMFDYSHRSGEM